MNMNHSSNGSHSTAYKIIGTVSPTSLGTEHEAQAEHTVALWAEYLAKQLSERMADVKDVEIRVAPFGGTRLEAIGRDLVPDSKSLRMVADTILTEFCFHYDQIAHHGMESGYPKPGEDEC